MQPILEPEPMPTGAGAAVVRRAEDLMAAMWPRHCFLQNF